MIAVRTIDVKNDFKRVSDLVHSGEEVLISRPRNENLVILTEAEYNTLKKAQRNAEYLAKLHRSMEQLADGRVVVKTLDELESLSAE